MSLYIHMYIYIYTWICISTFWQLRSNIMRPWSDSEDRLSPPSPSVSSLAVAPHPFTTIPCWLWHLRWPAMWIPDVWIHVKDSDDTNIQQSGHVQSPSHMPPSELGAMNPILLIFKTRSLWCQIILCSNPAWFHGFLGKLKGQTRYKTNDRCLIVDPCIPILPSNRMLCHG